MFKSTKSLKTAIWLKNLFKLEYYFIWLIQLCFFLWRKKNMVIWWKCFGLWWVCLVFYFLGNYNLSHTAFPKATFQTSLWRLLILNIIAFQTFFKLCLLIHVFVGYSTNENKQESICITLHLTHKDETPWTAWKQFLQYRCVFLSEVYFHEADGIHVMNADLDTHTCNQVVIYM